MKLALKGLDHIHAVRLTWPGARRGWATYSSVHVGVEGGHQDVTLVSRQLVCQPKTHSTNLGEDECPSESQGLSHMAPGRSQSTAGMPQGLRQRQLCVTRTWLEKTEKRPLTPVLMPTPHCDTKDSCKHCLLPNSGLMKERGKSQWQV